MKSIFVRVMNSDGFKIYFWPIALFYLFTLMLMLIFDPLVPGSLKEYVFVIILSTALIGCLWVLVARYRNIKGKSIGKRVIVLLIILTSLIVLSDVIGIYFKLVVPFIINS